MQSYKLCLIYSKVFTILTSTIMMDNMLYYDILSIFPECQLLSIVLLEKNKKHVAKTLTYLIPSYLVVGGGVSKVKGERWGRLWVGRSESYMLR